MTLVATIIGLFFWSSPAAVAGFVIPVVVDPIKGQSMRTFSHVCEKVNEIEPAFADGNASTSVAIPLIVIRIEASSFHVRPGNVRAGSFKSVALPMSILSGRCSFALDATATGCSATQQIVADNGCFGSAVAFAKPSCVRPFSPIRGAHQNHQTSEASVGKIDEVGHV